MKKKISIYLSTFLVTLAVMMLAWYFNGFYPFGVKSFLAIDFNQQFIDLYILLRRVIHTGDWGALFYSFTKSLGGNMVGAWAYYLLSPFNLFYVLFPIERMIDAVFFSVWLRYGAMALSMTYYLMKRHQGETKPFLTIAIATAYALNGFAVSYQMTPIFMDALWLLPLVMVGLERFLDGENPKQYIIFLALTFLIQYYMGYMISIFIAIYTFYYLWVKHVQKPQTNFYRESLIKILQLAAFSLLAIGLTGFILIPNIYNLVFSKGALSSSMVFDWHFQINPLDILAKYMIGAFDNDSWSAGPNLPNLYMGSLGLIGVFCYFTQKERPWKQKAGSAVVLLIFFLSICHEWTSKIWHMGQNPAGFFYRFSWILIFYLLILAFQGLKLSRVKDWQVMTGLGAWFMVMVIVMAGDYSFLSPIQIQLSALIAGIMMVGLYYFSNVFLKWGLVLILTFSELGANAYFSQEDINHNNAYKFQNALATIGQAVDQVRPDQHDFYRISKTFYRSKNDPMTFNYPGLTNFSSSLEGATRDLFERLGNSGVDAAIYYYGTPLTDALLSVKYLIQNEPFYSDDQAVIDQTYVFPTDVTRFDLVSQGHEVGKTDRFTFYQVPDSLPIAYGVNEATVRLNLLDNQPIMNQNLIAQTMTQSVDPFFEEVPVDWQTQDVNLGTTAEGHQIYTRKEGSETGEISLHFTPETDDPYFIKIPRSLSTYLNEVTLSLNDQSFAYRSKFTNDQVFNVASGAKGVEQTFKITLKADRQFDLTQLKLYRMDTKRVKDLIQSHQAEGLEVSEWGSNYVTGQVHIDHSDYLLTSIPYDEGWRVKIDGQSVQPIKAWDALLAFPINRGNHQVELTFIPKGLILGVGISIISLITLIICLIYCEKNRPRQIKKEEDHA